MTIGCSRGNISRNGNRVAFTTSRFVCRMIQIKLQLCDAKRVISGQESLAQRSQTHRGLNPTKLSWQASSVDLQKGALGRKISRLLNNLSSHLPYDLDKLHFLNAIEEAPSSQPFKTLDSRRGRCYNLLDGASPCCLCSYFQLNGLRQQVSRQYRGL